jgi:uncharacterized membrane protein YcfT
MDTIYFHLEDKVRFSFLTLVSASVSDLVTLCSFVFLCVRFGMRVQDFSVEEFR